MPPKVMVSVDRDSQERHNFEKRFKLGPFEFIAASDHKIVRFEIPSHLLFLLYFSAIDFIMVLKLCQTKRTQRLLGCLFFNPFLNFNQHPNKRLAFLILSFQNKEANLFESLLGATKRGKWEEISPKPSYCHTIACF